MFQAPKSHQDGQLGTACGEKFLIPIPVPANSARPADTLGGGAPGHPRAGHLAKPADPDTW
jgi:hypothetical protein